MESITVAPVPVTLPGESLPKVTYYEIAAWVIAFFVLIFVFEYHLVSMLLTALLVHGLIGILTGRFKGQGFSHSRAKVLALFVVVVAVAILATILVFAVIALATGRLGNLPSLLKDMAKAIDSVRTWMIPRGGGNLIPEEYADADMLRARLSEWLTANAEMIKKVGIDELLNLLHALVGIVLGALVSFEAQEPVGPLGKAMYERVVRFADAFDKIVFAQFKISALNTGLTAMYLFVIMPMFGVHLPHRATLVAVTFLAGLLPVVGNLISNSIIFVLSLKISAAAAVGSLIYLIVIHKLEYFLNARIVGGQIHAAAWEILLAMLCFEAAFGLPGLVMAPIIYAYTKKELSDRGLL